MKRAQWELMLIDLYKKTGAPHGRIEGTSYKYYVDEEVSLLVMVAGNSTRWISLEKLQEIET